MMFLKASRLNTLLTQHLSSQVSSILYVRFTCMKSRSILLTSHDSISDLRGALIAYSSPASPMALRMHATLASNIWSSYAALVAAGTISDALPPASETSLDGHTKDQGSKDDSITKLTLELSDGRLCVSQLQCGLLVCLMGPTPLLVQDGGTSINSSPQPQRASLPNGVSAMGSADGTSVPSRTSSSVHSRHDPHSTEMSTPSEQLLKRKTTSVVQHLDQELADFRMPASA